MSAYRSIKPNPWPAHVSNGGTGLLQAVEPAVAASVRAFADSTVFLKDGHLHTSRPPMPGSHMPDVRDFWAFHEQRARS